MAIPLKLVTCNSAEKGIPFLFDGQIWKISKINKTEQPADAKPPLTSGGAGDTAAALPQAGAVHHHPALVGLLPGLTDHVGRPGCVVIASLSCKREGDKSPPRAIPHWDASRKTRKKRPYTLTELGEKGAITYPQACRSTRPSHCPGTRTPACSRQSHGAGARYRRSCRTGHPHGSDLPRERWELRWVTPPGTASKGKGKGHLARGKGGQLGQRWEAVRRRRGAGNGHHLLQPAKWHLPFSTGTRHFLTLPSPVFSANPLQVSNHGWDLAGERGIPRAWGGAVSPSGPTQPEGWQGRVCLHLVLRWYSLGLSVAVPI